jgi:hypothetical protein
LAAAVLAALALLFALTGPSLAALLLLLAGL